MAFGFEASEMHKCNYCAINIPQELQDIKHSNQQTSRLLAVKIFTKVDILTLMI